MAGGSEKEIPSICYERVIRDEFLPQAFEWLKAMDVPLPYYVMLSLLNVKGFIIGLSGNEKRYIRGAFGTSLHFDKNKPLMADRIICPVVELNDMLSDIDEFMRPAFNRVWQAFGFPYSGNFTNVGKWRHST